MMEEKKTLFEDSVEMMKIFRAMPKAEQIAAIAYAMGAAGRPFETLIKASAPGKTA